MLHSNAKSEKLITFIHDEKSIFQLFRLAGLEITDHFYIPSQRFPELNESYFIIKKGQ